MRNALKLLLVMLYFAGNSSQYLGRFAELSATGLMPTVLFAGLFAVLSVSLLLSAFTRNDLLRWCVALLFATAAIPRDSYSRITNDLLSYGSFVSQVHSLGSIDEAIQQYWPSILRASGFGLLLLAGIGARPSAARPGPQSRRRVPLHGVIAGAAPLLGLLLLTAILFLRSGDGARGLPAMFTSLAYLNLFAYDALTEAVGPREPVRLTRAEGPVGNDIVLIIDESVSGNYLDINTPLGVFSGLKGPHPGVDAYNFGYAAAITNCSADVNVTLRFGGTRDDYARINARMPSIWQYARVAGLQTIYLDGQRTGGRLQNRMTELELKDVDQWVQFDRVAVRDRDMAIAERLATLIGDETPQLIVVNKMGAHFPVHDKFPDRFMAYEPALARGGFDDVADTGQRFGFAGTEADWSVYRNSYRNTLLWNVGEFFRRLLADGRLDNAVIVYTSDHGQDLHERGNPGQNTHCGGSPAIEEGLVPLVVLQGKNLRTLDWERHLSRNLNRSSHYTSSPPCCS